MYLVRLRNGYEVRILKIIVDKIPNEPKECIFSECTNQLRGNYACLQIIMRLNIWAIMW